MTQDLKNILDCYQNGFCTFDEFKRLVGWVSENKICKCCGEEFSPDKDDRFCPECQKDIYTPGDHCGDVNVDDVDFGDVAV